MKRTRCGAMQALPGPCGRAMLSAMAMALALASLFSAQAEAAPLQPRVAIDKQRAVFSVAGTAALDRLVVKFAEGSDVVQTVRGVMASRNPAVQAELRAIEALARSEGMSLGKLFSRFDAEQLAALKRSIESHSGEQLADLSLYFELPVPARMGRDRLARIVEFLNKQNAVEIAYASAPPQLAAVSKPTTTTLSYDSNQGYRQAAPSGIDAIYAATVAGGRGVDVRIADVEGGWRMTHEDMPVIKNLGGAMGDPAWVHHGTAVVGVMGARNNAWGVTGIVPDASFSVSGIANASPADAILKAGLEAGRGGVLLVELQQVGPADSSACSCNQAQCNSLPMEYWPAEFDAIKYLTAQGVTVVEAAGNGSVNLDDPVYNNYFNRSVRDSGAILVAASAAYTRTPACFTNHGSRIDAHGWGESVTTLGYGDLSGTSEDKLYTATFSGTSSATPIVAGAVAAVQGVNLVRKGDYLSPAAVRTLLRNTGTPQSGSLATAIGPLPNLKAALTSITPATTGVVTISGTILSGTTATSFTSIGGSGASCSINAAAGTYSCTVPNGWSGTLTPLRSSYSFTPASRSYAGVQANRTAQNFQIAPTASQISISGVVSNNGAPLSNVQIQASSTSGTATCTSTQLNGSYSCAVSAGWSGQLGAVATGYTFVPASRSFTNVSVSQTSQSFSTPVLTHTATVYYKRGFATPHIHYRPNGGSWTALPGKAMIDDEAYCGYSRYSIELGSATSVEVAFNDGGGNWDSNYGANYWFGEGASTYNAGTTTSGVPPAVPCKQTVTFKVSATTVWGENIYLIGNIPELGSWDAARAVQMSATGYPVWDVSLPLSVPSTFEYKYIRKNSTGAVTWEGGYNRSLSLSGGAALIQDDGSFRP